MTNNKTNKAKRNTLIVLFLIIPVIFAVYFLCVLLNGRGHLSSMAFLVTFKDYKFYLLSVATTVGIIAYLVYSTVVSEKRSVAKENDLNDSHFLTNREIDKNRAFLRLDLAQLQKHSDGIPVKAVVKGKGLEVIAYMKDEHVNILGAPGTGKTTGYIDPCIQILPRFKTKPGMIITDPKGELFQKHSDYLKQQGYSVLCVDYRKPFSSAKTNPLQPVIDRIRGIKCSILNRKNLYIVGDVAFHTYREAEEASAARRQLLMSEINTYLDDIIQTLFPSQNSKDPFWEDSVRDLTHGLILALVDDVINDKMPEEKFCLHNIYYLLSRYSSAAGIADLREFFEAHRDNLIAFSKAQAVCTAESDTLSSLLSTLMRYVNFLSDQGIRCMTAGNDITFATFDKEPVAVFVIFPYEVKTRHRFVSLFLVQAYKQLIDLANSNRAKGLTKDAELTRNCYFIMDEFGNLPKIPDFGGMLSISRQAKIRFLCVFQSYSQLHSVYEHTNAEKILAMQQLKVFIGTDDQKTLEAFSKLCGNKKIVTLSSSVGVGRDGSDSYSAKEQPLISPQELKLLCKDAAGEAVVSVLGQYPLRSSFTPSYKARSHYSIGAATEEIGKDEIFNEKSFEQDIRIDTVPTAPQPAEQQKVTAPESIPALTQEEIDQLNAEEAQRERLEKSGNTASCLTVAKNRKLLFIKDFLPDDTYANIISMEPRTAAVFIENLLSSDMELILPVRLELSSIIVLCQRIEEAQKEYETLQMYYKGATL